MSTINARVRRGAIERLFFRGDFSENQKVAKITECNIKNNAISFTPDIILLKEILERIPTTIMMPEVQRWLASEQKLYDQTLNTINDSDKLWEYDPRLYEFQNKGSHFLHSIKRGILADDRGLGKSVQALRAATRAGNDTMIVCPSYAIYHWVNEIQKWFPDSTTIPVVGSKKEKLNALTEYLNVREDGVTFLILSYTSTISEVYSAVLLGHHYTTIIYDEAHRISNRKTKQSQAAIQLSSLCDNMYFLTGSPLHTKYPDTLWVMLHCIDPVRFSSYWMFTNQYSEVVSTFYGMTKVGAKNIARLGKVLAPLLLRRVKAEVGFQLPPKITSRLYVDIPTPLRRAYDRIVKESKGKSYNITSGIAMAQYLQQLINCPDSLGFEAAPFKIPAIRDISEDVIKSGGCVLIYTIHRQAARAILESFDKYTIEVADGNVTPVRCVYIDGETPLPEREKRILQARGGEAQVMIATIGTMRDSINLEFISDVILVEQHWNPEVNEQAIDRTHRITSKDPVNITIILAKDSIETHIDDVCNDKSEHISDQHRIIRLMQSIGGDFSAG